MTDFLHRLAVRTLTPEWLVRPRPGSRFERDGRSEEEPTPELVEQTAEVEAAPGPPSELTPRAAPTAPPAEEGARRPPPWRKDAAPSATPTLSPARRVAPVANPASEA